MAENKLLDVPNSNNDNTKITNIKDIHTKKYCSKCLTVLGDSVVRDINNNEFCSFECKKNYWAEMRSDLDDIMSNFK